MSSTNSQLKQIEAKRIIETYLSGRESYKSIQRRLIANDTPLYAIDKGRGKITAMLKVNGVNIKVKF